MRLPADLAGAIARAGVATAAERRALSDALNVAMPDRRGDLGGECAVRPHSNRLIRTSRSP